MTPAEDMHSQLCDEIFNALRTWHQLTLDAPLLGSFRLVQEFQQHNNCSLRKAVNFVLEDALKQLPLSTVNEAGILRDRFQNGMTPQQTANKYSLSLSVFYVWQKKAVTDLARIVIAMEESAAQTEHDEREARAAQLERNLEVPTMPHLLGIDELVIQVNDKLNSPNGPKIIALTGIGGIGKTALAYTVVLHAFRTGHWVNVGWVTAGDAVFTLDGEITPLEQPALTAETLVDKLLRRLLPDVPLPASNALEKAIALLAEQTTSQPYLIVIDNLERVTDLARLLPILRRLLGPTVFLLTTRESLLAERDIDHFAVPQLNETYALQLVRQEAELCKLPDVANASDDQLRPIFETVGGNPLALRLVVGELCFHSLTDVIENLKEAQGEPIANLYTHIYGSAWAKLNESERRTLLAMLLVSKEGGTLDFLVNSSDLSRTELSTSLNKLIRLNLVDRRGNFELPLYSIHSLTRTFLLKQVLKWQ